MQQQEATQPIRICSKVKSDRISQYNSGPVKYSDRFYGKELPKDKALVKQY
jgi:hypothetical protein